MNFANKLTKLRKERNLTVSDLANQLDINELDISSFEDGVAQPNIDQLKKIASFFAVSNESLIDDDSEIIKSKKSIHKKLNALKLVAKLLYFFTISLCIVYFNSYLTTILFQRDSLKLIYGVEGKFIFPVVGFITITLFFLFFVLFSSKLATRLSKNTKGFGTEILVLLILPFVLLISELLLNLQSTIIMRNGVDSMHYIIRLNNMLIGSKAIVNGIVPLFIFALMISLVVKVLDKTPYKAKIIQREHKVWHNFIALLFGFNVGLFSLPFYIAFCKEQSHICKKSKMNTFYILGFIGSFWTTIIGILGVALLAYLRTLINF